jgi:transcriptional regulator with XRE-family HTH domain
MDIKDAVALRIRELCHAQGITINALAYNAGISPSTLFSMLNDKSKNPGVVTIQKVCDGLNISIAEFFRSPLFDDLEQVIR